MAAVAFDPSDSGTWAESIGRLLWYNVHATADATEKLGGQPYENQATVYTGSSDDERLNRDVARFSADAAARAAMAADYETSGTLGHDKLLPLEEVREQLRDYVRGEKMEAAVRDKLDELRAAATVEVLIPLSPRND